MAELTNRLHLKSGSTITECICYTTMDEATPKTVTGGSTWEIKNNNTVCYLGLVPSNLSGKTGFDTTLKVKKSGTEYLVQSKVLNYFTVTITQSDNQTIRVTCNGTTYTSSFQALAGSSYTVTVVPATGYTAGSPSSSSGYVNSNLTITASPASKASYLVTIVQSAHQTITVTCNGTNYTSNFTANYGDKWTATILASSGYKPGTLSATSGTIYGAVTISATAATVIQYKVTLKPVENGYWQLQGVNKNAGSYAYNSGTSVKVECFANSGYVKPTELTME